MLDRSTAAGTVWAHASACWPAVFAVCVLASLVGVVFFSVLNTDFINIDDEQQVIYNPYIRGLTGENLRHILTSPCIHSYYPVRTLSFAVDYQLWGLNPAGFKLTNVLIHLVNVLMVFWLIMRFFRDPLSSDGSHGIWQEATIAAFSAAIFAIHPVVVEPVTWVAGREELLMTLGALGCFHFHLSARRLAERSRSTGAVVACRAGAALCCAVACLSNAVAAAIPLLIVAWDILTLRPLRFWTIVGGSSALWAIAVATIVIKKLESNPQTTAFQPELFSAEWVALALNTYWVNLKTLAWPTKLAFSYSPLKPEGLLDPEVILGAAAISLTAALLWAIRRQKLVVYGVLWFGIALAPASQIMAHHVHHADRFLYLPLAGLVLAVAAGLKPLGRAIRGPWRWGGIVAATGLLLLLLVCLSAAQVQIWRNSVTLWEHSLKLDPNNATAHDLLGKVLNDQGQPERAAEHFRKAMELDADNPAVLQAVAMQHIMIEGMQNFPEAIRLARRACELTRWKDARHLRTLATVYAVLAESQTGQEDFASAIENCRRAIQTDPSFAPPLFVLARILATCPDQTRRDPGQAVLLVERGYQLTEQPGAEHFRILLDVYTAAGRLNQALTAAEAACRSAQARGDQGMVGEFRDRAQQLRDAISRAN